MTLLLKIKIKYRMTTLEKTDFYFKQVSYLKGAEVGRAMREAVGNICFLMN
jgi:hypothetical protein